ncbi:MAG: MerR family transcriptional regulator [Candidatus Omnitrophota bacterium]|nr:helix-turn-helix domain-containing protein [Candidatus Omnitrophota bacterium]
MDKFIAAKDIEKKYQLSYQIINRYTNVGLLKIAFKKGNIRYYDRAHVEAAIKKITELSQEGYPLMLIRKKLVGI